jgi:4'-phosphopantetheinyl transferase
MDHHKPASPLHPGEAHLWFFNLELFPPINDNWERLLSEEEITRSKRYIADRDRKRFVARRGILRQLLGRYLGVDPVEVNYQTDVNGKLSLPSCPLSFNLSTCENRVAYVFTLEKDIGVDIEQVHPLPELPLLIKSWFSAEEQGEMAALPSRLQVEAFYHVWTQKEAFIKARGTGLGQPVADFSVSVDPDKPGGLRSINNRPNDLRFWKMTCLKPEEDVHVAVCVRAEKEVESLVNIPRVEDFIPPVSYENPRQSV